MTGEDLVMRCRGPFINFQSNGPESRPMTTELHGFGLGLRPEHYNAILDQEPAIDWLEILSENYFVDGGRPLYFLDRICERYPLVMHRSEEHTSELQPLMRISYAVFCLKKQITILKITHEHLS